MVSDFLGKFLRRIPKEKNLNSLTPREYAKLIEEDLVTNYGYKRIGQCSFSSVVDHCKCYFLENEKGDVCLVGETKVASSDPDYVLLTKGVRFSYVCEFKGGCREIKRIERDPDLSKILEKTYSGSINASAFWILREKLTQQSSYPSSGEQS